MDTQVVNGFAVRIKPGISAKILLHSPDKPAYNNLLRKSAKIEAAVVVIGLGSAHPFGNTGSALGTLDSLLGLKKQVFQLSAVE